MIICAAIKIVDDPSNIVICGYRHSDCYALLHQLNPTMSRACRKLGMIEEGFMATGNKYLTRAEAFEEAKNCGQISASLYEFKASRGETELFSEDLY